MSDQAVALALLDAAVRLGPAIAEGVIALLSRERPELLPVGVGVPERQDGAIAAEDAERIRERFGP